MVLLYNLIRGRIEPGVYHEFGPAATGKTTIAMACAASIAARGTSCAWLDTTSGFSPKRFADISLGVTGEDHSSRVLFNKVANPLALDHALDLLVASMANWHCGLIVLDTVFGCIEQTIEDQVLRKVLWIQAREQLARLVLLATSSKIPLVLLNTVGYKPSRDQERPTGEAIVQTFAPESALVRPIIDVNGKTGRFTWLSCDDETEFTIETGGIKQRDTSLVPTGILHDDTEGEEDA
ncbi:MAG TPA: hypothetical protein VKM55_06225 [Candidatus Lokiarchaeia archaeon]|nr:hypothetical protein [Candidatus Lokiarchaeia archaeon]